MYWIGLITGITLTLLFILLSKIIFKGFWKTKHKKYIKRGLYSAEFTRTDKHGEAVDYNVYAEIGLVERTKNKIKIEVTNLRTSLYSDSNSKNQIINIIEGWRDINDKGIEWFEEHPSDVRANKIDQLIK